MSEVPDIYEMDPDEWFDQVQQEAEQLKKRVRRAFDQSQSLEELRDALQPLFEPYLIDPDDPVHAEQLMAEIKYGEKLCVGVKFGDWLELTYHDGGYWWFEKSEPRPGDGSVDQLHDYLAERVVSATNWGDQELARRRANEQKEHRRIAGEYLQQLKPALNGGEPTAGELREAFHSLLNNCLGADAEVVVADVSPHDHLTWVKLRDDSELFAHLVAVDPGDSLELEAIGEQLELTDDDHQKVAVVTDHRRFRWPALGEQAEPVTLKMPSEKSDDPVAYHRGCDWMVRRFRQGLTPQQR